MLIISTATNSLFLSAIIIEQFLSLFFCAWMLLDHQHIGHLLWKLSNNS